MDATDREWALSQVDLDVMNEATDQIVRSIGVIGGMFHEGTCDALTGVVDEFRTTDLAPDGGGVQHARDVLRAVQRCERLIGAVIAQHIGGPASERAGAHARAAIRLLCGSSDLAPTLDYLDVDLVRQASTS
ncbi:MAG TPA: hypothetical protein VNQ73_14360 [Ilumatobacter sp.]|nr:hypothetical protein [Ilumatobacter sp.]